MSTPTLGNGKICYIEIPTDDVTVSSFFYNKCFGWELRTRGDGTVAFDDTVGQVSGTWVPGRKPSADVGTLVSIMVDDIDATIQKVIDNGGIIVQPVGADHPEITARFADPAGNIFGLYQHRG